MLIQLTPRSNSLLKDMRNTMHLINTSTIIYFNDWGRPGFSFMAKKYFSQNDKESSLNAGEEAEEDPDVQITHLEEVIKCQVDMHEDAEMEARGYFAETGHYVYVTPQVFENFIRTYKKLLRRRKQELIGHRDRFKKGHDGINKCLRKTEETQEELSKRAP